MAKTLKKYNGRGVRRGEHLYVAAYNRSDASRMLAKLCGRSESSWQNELRNYFSECWGDSMEGIEPRRGIWKRVGHYSNKPVLVYDGETK